MNSRTRQQNLLRANRTITAERIVDAKCFFGKLCRNPKFLVAQLQTPRADTSQNFSKVSMGEQKTKDNLHPSPEEYSGAVFTLEESGVNGFCRTPVRETGSVPAIGEGMADEL